ncbi:MAG: dTDP-glucose 4,6-dehydratase 2 [Candidatus Heimdallarchaeota archaeon LC_2]|nr:MAG: dTDP-glucose 4,6-dehydratase 2 [Candidatus Heimdallarchaeota archaeon LC_2]
MPLLVTGVAGFIGSHFVDYYLQKHPNEIIVGLDKLTYASSMDKIHMMEQKFKDNFTFVKGDISNFELVNFIFEKYQINGVINFAAETHVDRSIEASLVFLQSNVLGTNVLLEVARANWLENHRWRENTKFLQISTDEVYGSLEDKAGLFSETTPMDPRSPYSASKASADLLVNSFFETYGMPVLISRCSNNYGSHQFPEKLIPKIIKNALNLEQIPVYGDGMQMRDWIYVKDHCAALELIFHSDKFGNVYNVGSSNEWHNIDIVKLILDKVKNKMNNPKINEDLISFVTDRLGHDRRYAIDSSKIQSDLGWNPKMKFEDGIDQTIDWYIELYKSNSTIEN